MVWADSHRISRALWYLGWMYKHTLFLFEYRAITFCGRLFNAVFLKKSLGLEYCIFNVQIPLPHCHNACRLSHDNGFLLFPFRSPLLRESLCFLFLILLRCFSSDRSPLYPIYSNKDTSHKIWLVGSPIQKPLDHRLIGSSPKLFVAFHAFLRLLMPRHPLYALFNYPNL